MDRRTVLALAAVAALSFAFVEQSSAQPPGANHPRHGAMRPNGMRAFPGLRERWRQMSPEERQRIRSNAERWLQLPPEERRELRFREAIRRERIRREAEAALQNSGIQLEPSKREQYEQRYFEERKRIDRELRREMEERRQRELAPIMEQLRKEFGNRQPDGAGVTGGANASSPSGSPKK